MAQLPHYQFTSLKDLAVFMQTRALRQVSHNYQQSLEMIGALVQSEVESRIGILQGASGPYPAWAPLSQVTIDKKGHDGPLLETGAFAGSVGFVAEHSRLRVTIGTDIPYIRFTEFGTRNMPPRPIFGPSVYDRRYLIRALVADSIVHGIAAVDYAWLRDNRMGYAAHQGYQGWRKRSTGMFGA